MNEISIRTKLQKFFVSTDEKFRESFTWLRKTLKRKLAVHDTKKASLPFLDWAFSWFFPPLIFSVWGIGAVLTPIARGLEPWQRHKNNSVAFKHWHSKYPSTIQCLGRRSAPCTQVWAVGPNSGVSSWVFTSVQSEPNTLGYCAWAASVNTVYESIPTPSEKPTCRR